MHEIMKYLIMPLRKSCCHFLFLRSPPCDANFHLNISTCRWSVGEFPGR